MHDVFLGASMALLMMMVLLLYRIVVGPTVIDRIVAVNIIGTKSIVILVLMGIIFDRLGMFVDIALGYGLLNFIASLAAAKYFKRHPSLKASSSSSSGDVNDH